MDFGDVKKEFAKSLKARKSGRPRAACGDRQEVSAAEQTHRDRLYIARTVRERRFASSTLLTGVPELADSPFVLGGLWGLHPELRRIIQALRHCLRPVPKGIELVGVFPGSRELEAMFELLNERIVGRFPDRESKRRPAP